MNTEKLKNKKVLVVDDEERNTFALRSYLETLDMDIALAENGKEAITLLRNGLKCGIILLDIMMPVMDGFETLAVLREDNNLRDIPVIAVTARTMTGDRAKCLEAGAKDYMSKPINLPELTYKIIKWIRTDEFQS